MLFPSNSVQYKFLLLNVIQEHVKKSTNLILLYNVHRDKEPVYRNSERKKLTTLEKMFFCEQNSDLSLLHSAQPGGNGGGKNTLFNSAQKVRKNASFLRVIANSLYTVE